MTPLAVELPDEVVKALAEQVADLLAARSTGPEPWVGVSEAAVHLGCKPQRIYDRVHRKDRSRIPHRKEGSRLLFRLSELDVWVESGDAGDA